MNASLLRADLDLSDLESLVMKDGRFFPIPFSVADQFPQEKISAFCHKHALYQFPTIELMQFLKHEIGSSKCIEIGSGNGCVGRSLQIKMTDNKMQERKDVRKIYAASGQPVITYGNDVEELDAVDAIKKYKPETVLACWVTHKWKDGMMTGNMYGIEEEKMFDHGVKKYIHVGNEATHFEKPILNNPALKLSVKRYSFPWLISRSMKRDQNVIYVFSV